MGIAESVGLAVLTGRVTERYVLQANERGRKEQRKLYEKGIYSSYAPTEFYTKAEAEEVKRRKSEPDQWEIEKVTTIREVVS